ncbi:hypothetical protein BDP55DRAFT_659136 [Colletotrichum godetiae]|uniref:Uncharacterized protein n=1 Tax=Colletotrichum godetiae TaxID=1209918 RepID=A0AAJ0ANY2_9PEZI|nr:uncharacterized protein BDP55DRAFT_659136 [Colletotrichum godetiae]KAK1687697.1 hypothetical protein BDP55DRAFT_659136 [Colletotrichum godetiae]
MSLTLWNYVLSCDCLSVCLSVCSSHPSNPKNCIIRGLLWNGKSCASKQDVRLAELHSEPLRQTIPGTCAYTGPEVCRSIEVPKLQISRLKYYGLGIPVPNITICWSQHSTHSRKEPRSDKGHN